jgi:hypothetical protein
MYNNYDEENDITGYQINDQVTEDIESQLNEDECADTVPFPIPNNVLPVHEIQEVVRVLWTENTETNGRPSKQFLKSLFELVCAEACNTIVTDNHSDKMINIYELAAAEFMKALESLPKKQYVMDNLMKFLPDNKFPDEFTTFIETIQS